jgi:hypothetical protein
MPTQQQIDLAKKYWYTQDQINQEIATPWTVKKTDIQRTINPAPVPWNTMDTSTWAPYVAPNVVNTNTFRDTAQTNADFVTNRVNGGKTVTNTTTSGGKTTKTYSDGTTETTDVGTPGQVTTQRDVLDQQNALLSDSDKLDTELRDRYAALQVWADESYKQLVTNTQNMFASTRTKLTDSNRRFEMKTSQGQYLNNWFRYTPQSSEGMVYDAEQAGIAKLADLDVQESEALRLAMVAKNTNDYKALNDYTTAVRNIQADKLATLRDMTTQIKTIEDTDKNIRNMNPNEAKFMQSMIDSYILTAGDMDAKKTEEYYKKQSKELSELMGFNVAPEFIKAQVEWAKASAKLEVNEALTQANGYYTDSLGRPMTNTDGKQIPFAKEDWGTWIEGNMLNVGTYDENGNKVMKTYELKGGEKSYAETLADMPPTQTNITVTALAQAYTWPMSELLMTKEGTFIPTTNKAYEGIWNGGMQCAEFVNRVTGTSFASGKAANVQPASTLGVGSIASWSPSGAGKYGHAGIIVGQEGDNWIIKSVNLRWNGIVSIDSIPKSVIEWGYTPDSVKNIPMEVSWVYDPNQDDNLTGIWSNEKWGLFLNKNTGETITGEEAKALYGSTVGQSTYNFTPDQIAVMQTITGKPTAGDKATLAKYGLDEAKLGKYRQEKASQSSAYDNLDNSTKSRVDKYVLDFENEQVVKDFNTMNIAIQTARTLADSGTDDQALIYTFAKVMDPNSVVRESEYDTVQRFSQSLAQWAYGKVDRVFGNDGFMTDSAKKAILATLEKKLNAQKISYDNIRNQTKKQIKWKASQLSDSELDDLLKQYDTTSTNNNVQTSSEPEFVDLSSI